MYSLNAATGDVAWSQMIGYSQLASVFVNRAFSGAASGRGGYEISIWFEGPYEDGDNLVFLIKGSMTGDPVTLERKESQGLISINGNTGKVNYQAKFSVFGKPGKGYAILGVGALNDLNDGYPAPIEIGNTIIAAGDELVVAVDKSSGKIKWQTQTPGLVTDLTEQDGALVAQIGKMVVSTAMDDKGKMKTKSTGAKPFGFAVIDVGSGSMKWSNTDFKVDPTLAMAGHVDDNVLYGCDGEKLYALSLADGKFKWKFDIKKEGKAGKITGDKAWAVKVEKSSFSGFGSTTTTTSWSDPRLILRAENRGGHFMVFGDKAIMRVDKDGTLVWTHAWKYDNDQRNLLFDPTFVGANDDIVYACKGFHGIDGKTGEVKWADKDVKGEFYLVSDDLLVVEHKDKVRGYSLK